jgi:HK97 family phage major capsid protein
MLWTAEAETLTEQVAVARKITLRAQKATILVRVSSELTEDAHAFGQELSTAMNAATAAGLDYAFIAGTGAGMPLGILNAPCTITVSKEGSQTADTIWLQNLVRMYGRMQPSAVKRAIWLVHPTAVPQLPTMTAVVKNVAGTENVGGGLAAAVTQGADGSLAIFGRPVEISDACSPIGDLGDIMFVALDQYVIGARREVTIERSTDVYFTTDEIGFKLRVRIDGQPKASAATMLRDGTNTVSDFVILEAR